MKRALAAVAVVVFLAGFLFLLDLALKSFARRPPEPPRIEADGRFASSGARPVPSSPVAS